jgi:RimJ/RimL family protein N-acetyltransferase
VTDSGGALTNMSDAIREWTKAAEERDDVVLLEIAVDGKPVGQIFLHDIDEQRGESLVGYHLLAEHRRRGIGTEALRLLIDYAREETSLETLVIITSGDNDASRRVAERAGFTLVGPPREDPDGLCFKLQMRR